MRPTTAPTEMATIVAPTSVQMRDRAKSPVGVCIPENLITERPARSKGNCRPISSAQGRSQRGKPRGDGEVEGTHRDATRRAEVGRGLDVPAELSAVARAHDVASSAEVHA